MSESLDVVPEPVEEVVQDVDVVPDNEQVEN